MTATTDVTTTVHRFTVRYRNAVLAKAALLALLGLGALGVLVWRLQMLRIGWLWRAGLPAALTLIAGGALAWWVHRHWIHSNEAATYLDQALGLQQRLITATEFASAKQPPVLYPLLLDDIAQRSSGRSTRVPRPLDRAAGVLIALLLLLLFWPLAGSSPLQQLAQLPKRPPMTPQQPPRQPPQPPQADRQQRSAASQTSASPQQSQAPSQQQPSAQSQGGAEQRAADSTQHTADSRQQTETTGDQRPETGNQRQARPGDRDRRAGATSDKQQGTSDRQQATGDTRHATRDKQQATSNKQQEPAESKQQTGGQQTGTSGQQQETGSGQQSTQRAQQDGQREGQSQQGAQQGQMAASLQQQQGSGGGQAPGNQEALKADIQELLKQVSGELKQLQAQLDAANDQIKPQAGTSTDPNLYGANEPMPPSGSSVPVPVQLQTDTAQISGTRPGAGTGKPSTDVAHEEPKTQAESAQLSDQSLDEAPTARQPIPPEYRSVFDQLRRSSAQPSEQK